MNTQSAAFLELLPPYLDGRSVTLQNMVRILALKRDLYIASDLLTVERTSELH